MSESCATAVAGTGRNGEPASAGPGLAASDIDSSSAARAAGTNDLIERTSSGSPSKGRDQVHFLAVPFHGDAHFLPGLPRAEPERVVVDVVHAHAVEADDDVAAADAGLLRGAAVAHVVQEHAAL